MIALFKACLLLNIYLFAYFVGRQDGAREFEKRAKGEIDKWDS